MSVIYRSIMSSMSIRVASGVLLMAILASSDVVNPVNNPVNSLTGEPLVLGFTSCVDFYDTACVWSYGNPDAVFLSFDTYDRRIDVLSMGKRWEFTNPQNPCSGGIQVINSTVNDSGSYWMRKGDGSDLHTSETVYANVLEEEHLMYVIQVNGEARNFSVSDGLLQTFPQIQPGDLSIRVVLGAGFPNSTTYTVKRSGEQACANNTWCTIHVDAHSMDDTLVVLDTDISGANQITIVIPLDQSTKPASANVPAIVLGVILVIFVIGAVAGFVIWRKKKRQNRRRPKTSSEEATAIHVQPPDIPMHAQVASLTSNRLEELQQLREKLASIPDQDLCMPPRDDALLNGVKSNCQRLQTHIKATEEKMNTKTDKVAPGEDKQKKKMADLKVEATVYDGKLLYLSEQLNACHEKLDAKLDDVEDGDKMDDGDVDMGVQLFGLHGLHDQCMKVQKNINERKNASMIIELRKYRIKYFEEELRELGPKVTTCYEATDKLQLGWIHDHPEETEEPVKTSPPQEPKDISPNKTNAKTKSKTSDKKDGKPTETPLKASVLLANFFKASKKK